MLSPQSRQLGTSVISHNCCYCSLLVWFSGALDNWNTISFESSYFPGSGGTRTIKFNIKVLLFLLLLLLLPLSLQKTFLPLPAYLLGKGRGSKPVSKTSTLICNLKSVITLPSDICCCMSVKSAKNTKKREMVMMVNFAHNTRHLCISSSTFR